jgi:hypothetical protein
MSTSGAGEFRDSALTRTQPPIQDPNTLLGLLNSNRNRPEISTSIYKPFGIIAVTRRSEAVEAIVTSVEMELVTKLSDMSVRMLLILDEFFDFGDFLSNISCEGLEGVLCLPEERHVEATHVV